MRRSQGFTLVEAAVAIGVVAILSGIIIPLVLKSLRDARNARARNDINIIVGAIANQLKDAGSHRPGDPAALGGGPGGASGAANNAWYSAGTEPRVTNAAVPPGPPAPAAPYVLAAGNNLFQHLFTPAQGTPDGILANNLFGLPGAAAGAEFQYKGPYMTQQVANSTDPWGRAYMVLGYNAAGAAVQGPIWVVSAGESGAIDVVNLGAAALGAGPAVWTPAGASATNIAVQVH
jgi:type II secretory pathway pseudopilin PulG